MSFTPEELRLLRIADQAEGADRRTRHARTGRPRSAPDTPRNQKARLRALQRYYRLKERRHALPS